MDFRSPSAGRRRRGILIIGITGGVLLVLVALIAAFRRDFSGGAPHVGDGSPTPSLSDLGWTLTSQGDFEGKSIDVVAGPSLRMRASTRGLRTSSTKFMGVRRREEIALKPGTRVSVDLDWNRQANGMGLSAGLLLAPNSTDGNPFEAPEAVWVEYKGVPGESRARRVIARRHESNHHHLDMDGWPERKDGRAIGLQKLAIEVGEGGSFRVFENGTAVYESAPGLLTFDRAYVYLQMSSGPNHPPREVYFSQVRVSTP